MAKHLTGYSLIWRVKATPWNRLLFQLAVSGRGTEEIESGLLLTPTTCEVEQDLEKFKKRMEKYPNGTTMPNLATQVNQIPQKAKEDVLPNGLVRNMGPRPLNGMFPTPTTQEIDHEGVEMTEAGRRKSKDGKNSHSLNLADTVKMFPTAASRDYKGARKPNTMKATGRNPETNSLPDAIEGENTGQLNPEWVTWLMGYPPGWLNLTSPESQKESKTE